MKNNSATRKQERRNRFRARLVEDLSRDLALVQDGGATAHETELAKTRMERNQDRIEELEMKS